MNCTGNSKKQMNILWHKVRELVLQRKVMTENALGPNPSLGRPLSQPISSSHQTTMELKSGSKPKQYNSKDLKSSTGLDPSQCRNNLSQDKVGNANNHTSNVSNQSKPTYLKRNGVDNASMDSSTQKSSSNSNSQCSNGANEMRNVDQASTRSSSTSSYIMGGIEGRRVDSGYHSVGCPDQLLRSTEEERKAPIAQISEISLTPEEDSEAPTPEFIFTSATPPSLPQSPLIEERRTDGARASSTKPKPGSLTLTEGKDSPDVPRGRGLVSSHDSLSPRRLRPKNIRRKHTVSGVTEEARAVLEQLLRRSFSQNDASPRSTLQGEYVGISEMTVIEEQPSQSDRDTQSEVPPQSPSVTRNKSYEAAVVAGPSSGPPPKSDSFDFTCDDDDLTSHSPVSKCNSIVSGSSRASSFKNRYAVRPLPTEDVEAALQGNVKKKTQLRRRPRKNSTGSSSSGSDYDIFDTKTGVRRKKSFFKRASERLRQSFRIKKERDRDLEDLSDAEKNKVKPKKRKQPKKKFSANRLDASNAREEIIHTHVHRHIHQEENKVDNGAVVVLHTEDIDVIQDGKDEHHVEVKLHTKESWPKEKEKKSLWDNILSKIRKGTHKLQKKGSTKGKAPQLQERSRSANALQDVTIQHNDNTVETLSQGGDRRRKITHSFREIFGGGNRRRSDYVEGGAGGTSTSSTGISRPPLAPLPPLPPPPSVSGYNVSDGLGDGRHDLRQQMRLDGLVAAQPNVPPGVHAYDVDIDVDRYDRVVHTRHGDRVLPMGVQQHQAYTFPDSFDDVDNVSPGFRQVVEENCNKPFELRTESEKDELYEKIAEQLAMIADNYNFSSQHGSMSRETPSFKDASLFAPAPTPATGVVSPLLGECEVLSSSVDPEPPVRETTVEVHGSLEVPEVVVVPGSPRVPAESPSTEGAVGGADENHLAAPSNLNHEARRAHSIERKIGAILRDKGDRHEVDVSNLQPLVTEIVKGVSYKQFQQALHSNLGHEPGWQQLAVMFRLTQSAVQLVGMGTASALHIKEMSLRYFEDKFASWIVGQGGWESMVSDTDLSSEVD